MAYNIDIDEDNPVKNYGLMSTLAQVSTYRIYAQRQT